MMDGPQLLLRRGDVERMTSLSRSTIYDLMAKGLFPRPVPLSRRSVAWIEAEVREWIDARIAARDLKETE